MKRIISLGMIAAALTLASCSAQQPVVNQQNETTALSAPAESPTEIAEATEVKKLTYNDYYNQALDEEYWVNIPDTPAEEFTYYELNSQFLSRTGYNSGICIESYIGNRTTVKIPETINGKAVLAITHAVLQGDGFDEPTIKELYIPDSVISYARLGYGNYEKIRLPQVTFPGSDDIGYELGIHKVKILALYGNKNVSFYPGSSYNSMEELYLAEGIEDIYCQENFFDTSSLKAIGIPASVTKIHDEGWGELENGKMGRLQPEVNIFGSTDVTIVCEEGSYAQEYAERFGLKTFIVE